jgi:hypothetical protein
VAGPFRELPALTVGLLTRCAATRAKKYYTGKSFVVLFVRFSPRPDFIGFTSHENCSSSLSRILFDGLQSVRFGPNSTIEPADKTSQRLGS